MQICLLFASAVVFIRYNCEQIKPTPSAMITTSPRAEEKQCTENDGTRSTIMSGTISWQLEDIKFILNRFSHIIRWNDNIKSVLHFGCGSGFVTARFLLPHLPASLEHILGVDTDPELIDYAKKYHRHTKVHYVMISADKWEHVGRFDHIFSVYYIDKAINERFLFQNFHKHLTKNGYLMLIVLSKHGIMQMLEEIQRNDKWSNYMKTDSEETRYNVPAKQLKQTLREVGFANVLCESFDRYQIFPNATIFKSFLITQIGKYGVPVHLHDDFIADMLSGEIATKIVRRVGKNKKVIAVPYELTFVHAKKIVITA